MIDKMIECPKCHEFFSLDDVFLEQLGEEINQKVADAEKKADERAANALLALGEKHEKELVRVREEQIEQAYEDSRVQSQKLEETEYALSRVERALAERDEEHERDIQRTREEAAEEAVKQHTSQLEEANYARNKAERVLAEQNEEHEHELTRVREEALNRAYEDSREQSKKLEEMEYALSRAQKALSDRDEEHERDIQRAREEVAEEVAKHQENLLEEATYDLRKAKRELEEREEGFERELARALEEEGEKAEKFSREQERKLEQAEAACSSAEKALAEQAEESKRELDSVRKEALEEAERQYRFQLEERDEKERRLTNKISELERQARQGSAELQGEVLEKWLNKTFKTQFPLDTIDEVNRGQYGADIVHKVINPMGKECGTIIWEAKRTQRWSPKWIEKIHEDATRVSAELKVIVSETLPEGIKTFSQLDGVWVSSVQSAPALGQALRQQLLQSYDLRRAMDGQGHKRDAIYAYLVSPSFRDHVQRIVLAWEESEQQILKEEKAMQAQWAARRRQLKTVLAVTNNMYADIRNIIGADELPQVEAFSFPELPPGESYDGTFPLIAEDGTASNLG